MNGPIAPNRFRLLLIGALALAVVGCTLPLKHLPGIGRPKPVEIAEESGVSDERPPTAKTLYSMARILTIQGKDAEAEQVLRRLIQEYPKFMPAYCDMAELQMRSDGIDKAITTLNVALDVLPKQPVLINNLGLCHLLIGEYHTALEYFTEASRLMPQDARYLANRAMALGLIGRYQQALEVYEECLNPWQAHHNVAIICEIRNDQARANDEFRLAQSMRGRP